MTSTPDKTGEAFVLHEGTKVRIVERFRDWIRVRIGDGNTGWVPEKVAKEI
ncbi:MAG: SH3 domain-containing protein [Saprospiraceae bacterium]